MQETMPTPDVIAEPVVTSEDRRRSPRGQQNVPAWLSPATGYGSPGGINGVQVRVQDLSLHGVGFTSDHVFKRGSVHWIVVAGGSLRISCRLRIATCRENDEGTFNCGGEFF
ncbi:MAG: PilZ domain-containing protein [Planctomycetota bacterium]